MNPARDCALENLGRWRALLNLPRPVTFERGAVCNCQPNSDFLVCSGLVKLMVSRVNGDTLALCLRLPGQFVKSCLIIGGGITPVAVTPVSAYPVDVRLLREVAASSLEASHLLLKCYSDDLNQFARSGLELRIHTVLERYELICDRLAHTQDFESGGIGIRHLIKDYELAQLIGITAPNFCRLKRGMFRSRQASRNRNCA